MLERGVQVLYVPSHLREKFKKVYATRGMAKMYGYPNGVQPGFIWSGPVRSTTFGPKDAYFVRYWAMRDGKVVLEQEDIPVLRTRSNSELTNTYDLWEWKLFNQSVVDYVVVMLEKEVH